MLSSIGSGPRQAVFPPDDRKSFLRRQLAMDVEIFLRALQLLLHAQYYSKGAAVI